MGLALPLIGDGSRRACARAVGDDVLVCNYPGAAFGMSSAVDMGRFLLEPKLTTQAASKPTPLGS